MGIQDFHKQETEKYFREKALPFTEKDRERWEKYQAAMAENREKYMRESERMIALTTILAHKTVVV